jgi:NAD(P)-dependent dehydrogenase (short-subunit alcohol dehydrogenase family)
MVIFCGVKFRGLADEIAKAVAFLASDDASYII